MMGLARGLPEFGLDPDDPSEVRGEKLWPILRAMAVNLLEEEYIHPMYLIEGDTLLPRPVARLMQDYRGRVKACFIGYAAATPEAKLREVRAGEANWLAGYSDAEALAFIADMVRFSRYLQAECASLGLKYFDCSDGPLDATEAAFAYLVAD